MKLGVEGAVMNRYFVGLFVLACACSNGGQTGELMDESTGGSAATAGSQPGTGGGQAAAGGSQAGVGGSPAGAGGHQAGTGGDQAGSGGDQAGTDGGPAGIGGGLAGIGGGPAGTGGAEAGTGGAEAGTGGSGGTAGGPFQEMKSTAPYDDSPVVSTDDLDELAAGNTAFALDMYQQLRTEVQDGLFFSPYSISVALAMTYAGAENQTETQMADTLHFTLPEERLHPAFNAVNLALNARGQGAAGQDGEGFRLNVVNSIWGQVGYPFLESFLDVLAVNYAAGLRLLDFVAAADASRVVINDWVELQTEDRIQDLLPEGSITTDTRMVLVNAVYFNAAWLSQFEPEMTQDGAFNTLSGQTVQVPMMRQTASFGQVDGEGFIAVDLLYDGEELSMLLIVPDEGQFETIEAGLTAEQISGILTRLTPQRVDLTMPKWTLEPDGISLSQMLATLGMPDAFSPMAADFSGMDEGHADLHISDVVHKAFVSVDEAGTEAAAATAVIIGVTSLPPSLTIDRPFIYLIRDVETKTILFMGRVTDPS